MDDDTKTDVLLGIRFLVRAGLLSKRDVEAELCTHFDDDELDLAWLRAALGLEWDRKLREQSTWPEHTDCDRLSHVFSELEAHGVVAAWSSEYTVTSALAAVRARTRRRARAAPRVTGYCVACGQDIEDALDGGGLWLAFCAVGADPDDAATAQVGRIVYEHLVRAGFEVRWDGTAQERLHIVRLDWKLRSKPAAD